MSKKTVNEYKAEIIVIGDELLSGETVDTNSNYLDAQLEKAGWVVTRHMTVADKTDEIASVVRAASKRSNLVLCSGGLGPTRDDLTLEALAQALGCGLRQDMEVLASIEAMFEKIGRKMTPNNQRQSFVPEIGEVIPNPVGTAPCFTAPLNDSHVYLLPGVPRELKWLFRERILPRIDRGTADVHRRTLKIIGLGESRLEHTIKDVIREHHDKLTFGFRAIGVENHIKIMASGAQGVDAIRIAENELREVLQGRVFGADEEELAGVIGRLLLEKKETIALAESCTGGLISTLLTDVEGASSYVVGACVTYSNESKTNLLNVPKSLIENHGAVSVEVAEAMALGAQKRLNSTWSLSATGIAGPGGGTSEKPVGTVCMALAGPGFVQSFRKHVLGNRPGVRRNTALALLEMLRRKLLNISDLE